MEAYQERGYEARGSIFKPGEAEAFVRAGLDMLADLRPADGPA